jgi:hypothetical protein
MLPLIKFYQRSNWTKKQQVLNILLVVLLFFLIYAPLHELCHYICAKLMNIDVIGHQFFNKYSFGKLKNAHLIIDFSPLTNRQIFIMTIAPYARDMIFAFVSFLILKRKQINSSFLVGVFFSIGLLFSVFDIADNFLGYIIKGIGDWYSLSKIIGHFWTWFTGIIMLSITLFLTYRIFVTYKGFPEKNE